MTRFAPKPRSRGSAVEASCRPGSGMVSIAAFVEHYNHRRYHYRHEARLAFAPLALSV